MSEHPDPGGTPEPRQGSLTRTPTTPEQSRAGEIEPPVPTPGSHASDPAGQERGKHVEPGN
jgi:hypothetical protein